MDKPLVPSAARCFAPAVIALATVVAACGPKPAAKTGTPYVWSLPPGFPTPKVPDANPMTVEKVTLGRYLFYDKNLSGNQTLACASCHQQAHAFTDTRVKGVGDTGLNTLHNSMSLTNVAYNSVYTWWNNSVLTLELQAQGPMFNTSPPELGLSGLETTVSARLKAEPNYPAMFADAFPDDGDPLSPTVVFPNVINAIASFERTLISGNSPYDRYIYLHDATEFTASAQAGMSLFFSETCECYHCHGSFNFTDAAQEAGTMLASLPYHNTGLYNIGGTGAYPAGDTGLMMETGNPADMGKFRAPTLRNIVYTAPYFHDGSAATLNDVLAHYAAGGRTITSGPDAGDGATSPLKGPFVRGFTLTAAQTADLLAFIESASDPDFVTNPAFSDPNAAP